MPFLRFFSLQDRRYCLCKILIQHTVLFGTIISIQSKTKHVRYKFLWLVSQNKANKSWVFMAEDKNSFIWTEHMKCSSVCWHKRLNMWICNAPSIDITWHCAKGCIELSDHGEFCWNKHRLCFPIPTKKTTFGEKRSRQRPFHIVLATCIGQRRIILHSRDRTMQKNDWDHFPTCVEKQCAMA